MHEADSSVRVERILSGKLRRYHTLPWWRQLLRPFSIVLPNIRDMFLVILGLIQSFVKLLLWRPDVVFTKGGFVCLPIGLAARVLGIPLVIHDSDAHPGLTNRILARFATTIATGAPLAYYPYPKERSHYVGIPINPAFRPISPEKQMVLKQEIGVDPKQPFVLITGGGLGAQNINEAVMKRAGALIESASILLVTGKAQFETVKAGLSEVDARLQLRSFVMPEDFIKYSSAADLIVTRAGATTILELAAAAKPVILIPSSFLSAGHQLKNAAELAKYNAVEMIDELELMANPQLLADAVTALLANRKRLASMAKAFHKLAKPHAAKDVAALILAAIPKKKGGS